MLRILCGAYSGTKVPVGTTQIPYKEVPVGTTRLILVLRNLYLFYRYGSTRRYLQNLYSFYRYGSTCRYYRDSLYGSIRWYY